MNKSYQILSLSKLIAMLTPLFLVGGLFGLMARCVILIPILLMISVPGNTKDLYQPSEGLYHKISNGKPTINTPQKILDFDPKKTKRVIIRLKKRHGQKTNKGVRTGRKTKGIAALKKEARSNQKNLIQYLENKGNRNRRGSHRMRETRKATRSFWLSNCIAITATAEEIKEIANHPDVAEIIENVILSIPPIVANDIDESSDMDFWNHALIGMDEVKQLGFDGSHIRVGHLDTGIDSDNPELKGKLIAWAEFGLDGEKIESLPHDSHPLGHGTHTASVIAGETTGIAPGVSIISALVLEEGYGTIIQALAGMQWVLDPDNDPDTDDGAQIVNMSWGAPGISDVLNDAIKNMKDAGVLPVCAIGNSGYGTILSPGNAPDAVGVGAVGRNDYVSWFSGGGEVFWDDLAIVKPDMTAPGVDIPGIGLDEAYQSMSGTSFAAPHVAGAAAILMELYPDLTLAQIKSFLYNTCPDIRKLGIDTQYGHGRLDVSSAVDFLIRYNDRVGANDLIIKTVQAMSGYTSHQFKSFFSNGELILPQEHTETAVAYPENTPIGLSDVNGDGFSDLVVEETTSFKNEGYLHKYQVYLSENGKGLAKYSETWFSYFSNSPDPYEAIGLADVNGDKRSDLIYLEKAPQAYGTMCNVKVLLSLENQKFSDDSQTWTIFYSPNYNLNTFHIGDMDGDGKTDLVLESINQYSIYSPVLYKVGVSDGTQFAPFRQWLTSFYSSYSGTSTLQYVKDANGDGYDDLIFTSQGYNASGYVWIYVATSNGASNFNRKQLWGQISLDENSTIAGMGDVNNDGAFDLLLNHDSYLGYTFDAWLSNGENQFTRPSSSWFKIDYIPYNSEIQFIGVGNIGLGNWDK